MSAYGLISLDNYLGTNGDPVYIQGVRYYKVVLPKDRNIVVYVAGSKGEGYGS
jgi:hypothetical protein